MIIPSERGTTLNQTFPDPSEYFKTITVNQENTKDEKLLGKYSDTLPRDIGIVKDSRISTGGGTLFERRYLIPDSASQLFPNKVLFNAFKFPAK